MDVTVLSREEDPKDEVIETMIRSAIAVLKLGMYEDGMARFEEILECGTTSFKLLGTIYMWYGRVCRKLEHHDKALEFFEHELNTYRLTSDIPAAYDATRRLAELSLSTGKFSKAKRATEDFLDTVISKKSDSFVQEARILLAKTCLEGFEMNLEKNPDEKKKLLIISSEQLLEAKKACGDATSLSLLMLEAKLAALSGNRGEAREVYQKCIDYCIKTKALSSIHRVYYEIATFAEENYILFVINDLRSALIYATKYGTQREVVRYKLELAEKLLAFGNAHEAHIHASEALVLARKHASQSSIVESLLLLSQCLLALGENSQAAYFLVLGSILTVKKEKIGKEDTEVDKENQQLAEECSSKPAEPKFPGSDLPKFYSRIDSLMTTLNSEKTVVSETELVEDVQLPVDCSMDVTPDETAAKFIVKLEHTTTLETWRMAVNDVIEVPKKKVEQKEEEPLDFMDLIAKMNNRMDDQRTELPAAMFNRPRPLSSASSRKTIKSHRILPGLRGNFAKLSDMKIDRNALNKLLKRSKKSKVSIHSNSTQGEDTRSDVTFDDSLLTNTK